ncbi:olfactory receptor 5A2-like [Tachyglossus aculeatus]|uniref:olfactory receptor 5A2-like n=1 Tax=Tachyglossus aculeatus TaxID=9261 RepID=UPI0018F5748E|nr:olfactory receptor 5A2-like [Tachyglossus aculeatus]
MSRGRNTTVVTEFILLGFSDHPELKIFLFVLFLAVYLVTLTWNLGLSSLIKISPHLHIPMYFFLRHLSFIDMCYSSSVIPKMLSDFFKEQRTISLLGCVTQYFVFSWLGLTECCLLATMAYDRYAAICTPLLYTTIMSPSLCRKMMVAAYTGGFLGALTQTGLLYQQDFCGPNIIHHFFCDLRPLLTLSCSDTSTTQVMVFIVGVVIGMMSMLVVLLSYGYITVAVLLIRSARGRYKTFTTCASHLTTVILFYGSGFFVYMRLNSSYSESQDKVVSLFYSVLIPMLNPLIYSLRNREILDTLKRVMEKKATNSKHDGKHFNPLHHKNTKEIGIGLNFSGALPQWSRLVSVPKFHLVTGGDQRVRLAGVGVRRTLVRTHSLHLTSVAQSENESEATSA